jgi:hypothetical protein
VFSELINEALEAGFDRAIQEKLKKLQKNLERAKRFELSTFTLAR